MMMIDQYNDVNILLYLARPNGSPHRMPCLLIASSILQRVVWSVKQLLSYTPRAFLRAYVQDCGTMPAEQQNRRQICS